MDINNSSCNYSSNNKLKGSKQPFRYPSKDNH